MVRRSKTQRNATGQRARDRWSKSFLASLRLVGNITKACEVAKIERSTAYRRRETDQVFAAAWDEAIEQSIDRLELEARRRAEEGVHKTVLYKGQPVADEYEYSDTLMTLLLKAHRPEKFGDKLTIRITSTQAAILKDEGLSPDEAFAQFVAMIEAEHRERANTD